jgi:Rrf2 family protein
MIRSSRFFVAVHALALLAHAGGGAMTSDGIAASVNTNPVVVRRVLGRLARAGLVVTQKGAKGGVRLRRRATEIELGTVYAAVEDGPLFASPPRRPNTACPVGSGLACALDPALLAAEEAVQEALARTTVAAVVRRLRSIRRSA